MTTTNKSVVVDCQADGERVDAIIMKIAEALDEEVQSDVGPVIIAMLALTLELQKPNISPDQIVDGVRDVSRYICLLLDGMDSNDGAEIVEELAPSKVN